MEFFKRRKENETTKPVEAVVPAPQETPPPSPVQPDSAALEEARQSAEEQIRRMERTIAQERDLWAAKSKEKEEELISLKAHLDMLMRRAEQEKEKRDSKLKLLQQQIQRDLQETERSLEAEIATWTERLSTKEKQIEETRHDGIFQETQKKIESEQNLRALQAALEQVEQKYKGLERKLLVEQNEWVARIKGREEEILNIKTQISLRDAQLRTDEEKSQLTKKEMEAAWQAQIAELDAKLKSQQEEWAKNYRVREEELRSLKNALEERLSTISIETERREKEVRAITGRLEEKIRLTEAKLAEDRTQWQQMLGAREEEFKQLKVELMLQESQEKTEREKKLQEFKETEAQATRQLKDIRHKIEEEKLNWQKGLNAKDEEIKVFKIQAEVKLKEIYAALETKSAAAADEKASLEAKLEELKGRFAEQKTYWEQESAAKNAEIAAYQKEWQDRQSALLASGEQSLTELKLGKETLEKELFALEEKFRQEKLRWQDLINQKTSELLVLKNECSVKESRAQSELDTVEQGLKREQQPALDHIRSLENRINEYRAQMQGEVAKKELQKKALQEQYARREETLKERFAVQAGKIKSLETMAREKTAQTKAQSEEHARQSMESLLRLQQDGEALRAKLASLQAAFDAKKDELTRIYKDKEQELAQAVERRESEYAELKESVRAEIEAKNAEIDAAQASLQAAEDRLQQECAERERQCAEEKALAEQELAALEQETQALKARHEKDMTARTEEIEILARTLADTEVRLKQEIEQLGIDLEEKLAPRREKKAKLEADIAAEQARARTEIAAREQELAALRTTHAEREAAFALQVKEADAKLAALKSEYAVRFKALQAERQALENQVHQETFGKKEEHARLENELKMRKEQFERQRENLRHEHQELAARLAAETEQLKEDKSRLEKEFPETLAAKQDEIAGLEKQMVQRSAFYQQQQEQGERSAENFQRRTERRLVQYRAQIEQRRERYQQELAALEQRLAALNDDLAAKEAAYQDELQREGKTFAEEKYKLEKQKAEVEEKLKDLQMHSREQIRQKEKEVLGLQTELAEKEKIWEQTWQQKEQELNAEKNLLLEELELLDKKLNDEESASRQKLEAKHAEIAKAQADYAERLQKLGTEVADKKRAWSEAQRQLREQVKVLSDNFDALTRSWEETRAAKEKELTVLHSNLEFWEQRSKAEEQKRLADWDAEKKSFEQKIARANEDLLRVQKDFAQQLADVESALERTTGDAKTAEEEASRQWKETEGILVHEKDGLLAEIGLWEKKIKDETATIERERKELDRQIEKIKTESALKDAALASDKQKTERKWLKAQQELQDRLDDLERRLREEKDAWQGRLKIKEEELKTLKIRLALREERRQGVIVQRRQEIDRILAQLKEELTETASRYNARVPDLKEQREARIAELAALSEEIARKEETWNQAQAENGGAAQASFDMLSGDLQKLEEELTQESRRLEQLFHVKEQQIQFLTSQMSSKEGELAAEKAHSNEVISFLHGKRGEMASKMKVTPPASDAEMSGLLDEAMDLYNRTEYAKAKAALEKILSKRPRFAGAYQYLSLCHYGLGEKNEAMLAAQRALELEPQNEELKSWIESIRSDTNKNTTEENHHG